MRDATDQRTVKTQWGAPRAAQAGCAPSTSVAPLSSRASRIHATNVAQKASSASAWSCSVQMMLPGVRSVAERVYGYWAQRRYARLYGCVLPERVKE